MSKLLSLVPSSRLKYLTKIRDITIDDITFRLHYRFTFSFLLIGSLLLSGEQFFGRPMQCLEIASKDKASVPTKVIESYCWIEGTFTLPKGLMKVIGYEVAAPGVEQYAEFLEEAKREPDEIIEHSYYQWVPIVLFIQALSFYLGHLMWKSWEKNRIANIINDLNKAILKEEKKTEGRRKLVEYLHFNIGKNNGYAFHYFLCESFNFCNIVVQMIFINWLLNGEFSSYGFDVLSILDTDPSQRIDPMAKVFPKMAKCTFRKFGPSGQVEKSDHLSVLSMLQLIFRIMVIIMPFTRTFVLGRMNRLTDSQDIDTILENASYADWFVIYLLSKNIDPMHFRDVVKDLAKKINDGESAKVYEPQINESNV